MKKLFLSLSLSLSLSSLTALSFPEGSCKNCDPETLADVESLKKDLGLEKSDVVVLDKLEETDLKQIDDNDLVLVKTTDSSAKKHHPAYVFIVKATTQGLGTIIGGTTTIIAGIATGIALEKRGVIKHKSTAKEVFILSVAALAEFGSVLGYKVGKKVGNWILGPLPEKIEKSKKTEAPKK